MSIPSEDDLKRFSFPEFDKPLPEAGSLSMEDYLKFVLMSLELFPDRQQDQQPIGARFSLK